MSDDRTLERVARSWLEEGPTRAPEQAVQAALARIEGTPQERAWPFRPTGPWVIRAKASSWAVVVVTIAVLSGVLVFQLGTAQGPGESPTPSPSPSTSPSATPGPSASLTPQADQSASTDSGAAGPPVLTATFVSPRNGYSVQYPGDWAATPATESWTAGAGAQWDSPSLDELRGPTARFAGASQALASGETADQWLSTYATGSCLGAPVGWPRVSVDSNTGFVDANGCRAPNPPAGKGGRLFDAVVIVGGRAYSFAMEGELTYADFLAFLSTITLDPAGAVDPTTTP